MKTLYVLASITVVLLMVAPNRSEAQKRKATNSKQTYVLNESRARSLVEDYVRNHRGTSVMVGTPDIAADLSQETLVYYGNDSTDSTPLTAEKFFLKKLLRAGLVNVNTRSVSITNITGEYEPQSKVDGACSYHFKISHISETSPFVRGSADWVSTLYSKCDWKQNGTVTGVVTESGDIFLSLSGGMASVNCQYILVNDTLQSKGGEASESGCKGMPFWNFRRTTGDMPPLNITKYKYSLTDKATALGLSATGGQVKIGETTIDSVSNLLLQGETNATGTAKFSVKYNTLGAVLMPGRAETRTIPVRFGQKPDRTWVVIGQ
jgi:hypothetical protein